MFRLQQAQNKAHHYRPAKTHYPMVQSPTDLPGPLADGRAASDAVRAYLCNMQMDPCYSPMAAPRDRPAWGASKSWPIRILASPSAFFATRATLPRISDSC